MAADPWRVATPGRVAPRECVAAARDDLNKAWQQGSDYRLMVMHCRSALDWLRRALEQYPTEELLTPAPVQPNAGAHDREPSTEGAHKEDLSGGVL